MHSTRRHVLGQLGSVALVGLASKTASAQSGTFNYKIVHGVQTTLPIHIRLSEAAEKIRQETDGKVNFRLYPNGQLGSDTDVLSQVRSGGVELFAAAGVVLANLVPAASLNSMAFIFPNYAAVWPAMDGALGAHIRAQIRKTNLYVSETAWDGGFRQITSNKIITGPGDLAGVKIRVPVSPLLLSLFKALGSSPTPINFNELYSSLQTKIVAAQENPLTIISSAKLFEVQKNCALTSHSWDGYWLIGNRRAMEALPAAAQEIVNKHLNAAAVSQRADNEKLNMMLQADLTAKGMVFNTPANAPFRKALQEASFYAEWKAKFGEESWAQLEAAVGKLA